MRRSPTSHVSDDDLSPMYKCMYLNKITISANIQNESEIMSKLPLLMSAMLDAFITMDVTYIISITNTTKTPNLGNTGDDTKNQSMHAKYRDMHESRMMDDVADMRSLVAMSIIHLVMNPVIGKYSRIFNNGMRSVLFICWQWSAVRFIVMYNDYIINEYNQ